MFSKIGRKRVPHWMLRVVHDVACKEKGPIGVSESVEEAGTVCLAIHFWQVAGDKLNDVAHSAVLLWQEYA